MNRIAVTAVVGLGVAACSLVSRATQNGWPGGSQPYVIAEKAAYLMMPPVSVTGTTTEHFAWSPSGAHLLAFQNGAKVMPEALKSVLDGGNKISDLRGDCNLVAWSTKTQTGTTMWKQRLGFGSRAEIYWLADSETALIIVADGMPPTEGGPQRPTHFLLRLNVVTKRTDVLRTWDRSADEDISIYTNPVRPDAVVVRTSRTLIINDPVNRTPSFDGVIHHVAATGPLSGGIEVTGDPTSIVWTKAGAPMLYIGGKRDFATVAPIDFIRGLVDRGNSMNLTLDDLAKTREELEYERITPTIDLPRPVIRHLYVHRAQLPYGQAEKPVGFTTLQTDEKSEKQQAMIAADADVAQLNRTMTAVAYLSNGALFVRPIAQVTVEQAREALAAAQRSVALSNARQCALGLMMYASDYDDVLPSEFGENVLPYLKNRDIMQGFVYTFPGGNMADIKDPSRTEIGYISGPGGKAIAYADGSVRWVKD